MPTSIGEPPKSALVLAGVGTLRPIHRPHVWIADRLVVVDLGRVLVLVNQSRERFTVALDRAGPSYASPPGCACGVRLHAVDGSGVGRGPVPAPLSGTVSLGIGLVYTLRSGEPGCSVHTVSRVLRAIPLLPRLTSASGTNRARCPGNGGPEATAKRGGAAGNTRRMTLPEMRLALYLLVTLLFNGLTIATIALEGGWAAAFLPMMGTVFAIQLGRTLPRRDMNRPKPAGSQDSTK